MERDAGMRLMLLTKYNTAMPGRAARPGLDPGWLAGRLALFDAWPLPAVRAQTRRPDDWLVFVDAETDAGHLAALRERLAGLGRLVRVEGALTDARIGDIVAAEVAPGQGRLLSARLDSDDAIAAGYLARMAAAAAGWRGFVNAPLGYRVSGDRVLLARERSGPFLGFVEELGRGRPLTVFQVPHGDAAARAPVRQLAGRPAWVQVVHGGNLANAFSGWPADGAAVAADMGLECLRARGFDGRLGPRQRAGAAARQLHGELAERVRGWTRLGRSGWKRPVGDAS